MTLDDELLRGLFEHKILKPTNIRTSQGNVQDLAQLRQIMNAGLKFQQNLKKDKIIYYLKTIPSPL